jgi:hypothetical protein
MYLSWLTMWWDTASRLRKVLRMKFSFSWLSNRTTSCRFQQFEFTKHFRFICTSTLPMKILFTLLSTSSLIKSHKRNTMKKKRSLYATSSKKWSERYKNHMESGTCQSSTKLWPLWAKDKSPYPYIYP